MNCLARFETILGHPLLQACKELLTDPFSHLSKMRFFFANSRFVDQSSLLYARLGEAFPATRRPRLRFFFIS
jgi:hypothetical protein